MPQSTGYNKNRLTARKWQQQVVRAKSLLAAAREKRDERTSVWRRADQYYKGLQWGTTSMGQGDGKLVVPYVFSTITTIIPYVTANAPQFRVEPYSKDATLQSAREQTAWLNKEWRSQRMEGDLHLRRAAFDSALYGNGYLMVSYDFAPSFNANSPISDGEVVELWVDRVSPWDVWLDPQANSMLDSRFVFRRVRMSLAELKANKLYQNTKDLVASQHGDGENDRDRNDSVPPQTEDENDSLVDVFEFYDIEQKLLVVFTEGTEKPLRIVEGLRLPLIDLPNHELPGSPYSMGDVEQVFVLQDEINVTRSQMMEHRKRNVNKWAIREGVISPAGIEALRSQETNAVVTIDSDEPIENILKVMSPPSISADAYQNYVTAKEDVYEVTGLSEYVRGGTPNIRKTATEASIIEASTNVKTNHRLRQIERAARISGQLMRDFASELYPQTAPEERGMVLTGREAQEVSGDANAASVNLTLNDETWVGRFEVFVEIGSTMLRNPAEREQKYKDLFLTLFPLFQELGAVGIQLNYRKMLELWFEAAGVDDLDAMFQGNATGTGGLDPGLLAGLPGGEAGLPAGAGGLPPGAPNFDGAGPPLGALDESNTGTLPPLTGSY
jgi:hypothetical protein